MATPHVTGAIALLAAQNPSMDWRGLKNLLLAGGDARTSLAQTVTGKRLNLNGSMTCAAKTVKSRLQPVNDAIAATASTPVTLEALNINCSQAAGNVQVAVSPGYRRSRWSTMVPERIRPPGTASTQRNGLQLRWAATHSPFPVRM